MNYIEKKILDIDPVILQQQLEQVGAVKVYDGIRELISFDTQDRIYRDAPNIIRLTIENIESITIKPICLLSLTFFFDLHATLSILKYLYFHLYYELLE